MPAAARSRLRRFSLKVAAAAAALLPNTQALQSAIDNSVEKREIRPYSERTGGKAGLGEVTEGLLPVTASHFNGGVARFSFVDA